MASTLAEIKTRFKTRIRADLAAASLSVSDIHDDSIAQWANEETVTVIKFLPNPAFHFKDLMVMNQAVTLAASVLDSAATATIETSWNYQRPVAFKVSASYTDKNGDTVTVSNRDAEIFINPKDFYRYDSGNFLTTPTGKRPIVLIADKIYAKPSTITSGKFDFIKSHPTIDASNGTKFDNVGDNLLVLLIIRRYYQFIEEEGLVKTIDQEIGVYVGNQ